MGADYVDAVDRKLAEMAAEHRPLCEEDYLAVRSFLQHIKAGELDLADCNAALEGHAPALAGEPVSARVRALVHRVAGLEHQNAALAQGITLGSFQSHLANPYRVNQA